MPGLFSDEDPSEQAQAGACGAPVREWAQQTFLVGPGEWAQVRYNGRSSYGYTDYWGYEKTVVNVGVFPKPRDGMFFTKPTYRYSLMSELW